MFAVSVSLSVMQLKLAAACTVYVACHVRGVIQCSLHQMPLAFCLIFVDYFFTHFAVNLQLAFGF